MTRTGQAILTIAGSDPSGGAGIQADLKTFAVLGSYGCAAITSITVQNSLGVRSCHPLPPELVSQQIAAVLDDLPVTHTKIGMIGSAAIGEAICQALEGFTGEVVYDPVVFSSVGQPVQTTDTLDGVRLVAARATILTPNLQELALISGRVDDTSPGALDAGRMILDAHPRLKAVVIKGGHLAPEQDMVTDTLLLADNAQAITKSHPRIVSANTHGTGCTFASALAAFHQHCGDVPEAFRLSVDFLDSLLRESAYWRLGHGTGGLCHHLYRKTD